MTRPETRAEHEIAIQAHEAAIEAHEDAIRRRSEIGSYDAALQTMTAHEQSLMAIREDAEMMLAFSDLALASGEAEYAVEAAGERRMPEARKAHRAAIGFHRAVIETHRTGIAALAHTLVAMGE